MAGRGPAPKDPRRRAHRNNDAAKPVRYVEITPDAQPELQELLGDVNPVTGDPWSEYTLSLWDALEGFPSTEGLLRAQWALLARAMILDDLVMAGQVHRAQEFRLQVAKFFVTPDDLMRGRIVTAQAEEADAKRPVGSSSRERYASLTVLPGG